MSSFGKVAVVDDPVQSVVVSFGTTVVLLGAGVVVTVVFPVVVKFTVVVGVVTVVVAIKQPLTPIFSLNKLGGTSEMLHLAKAPIFPAEVLT